MYGHLCGGSHLVTPPDGNSSLPPLSCFSWRVVSGASDSPPQAAARLQPQLWAGCRAERGTTLLLNQKSVLGLKEEYFRQFFLLRSVHAFLVKREKRSPLAPAYVRLAQNCWAAVRVRSSLGDVLLSCGATGWLEPLLARGNRARQQRFSPSFQGLSLWLYVGEQSGGPGPGGCCAPTPAGCREGRWSGAGGGLWGAAAGAEAATSQCRITPC